MMAGISEARNQRIGRFAAYLYTNGFELDLRRTPVLGRNSVPIQMYPLLQRWLLDLAVDVEEIGSFPARPSTTFTQHVAAVRRSCHRELLQLGMWRKPLTSLIDHELPGASLTIEELVSGQGDFTARVLRLVEVMALHLEQHGYEVAATDRRCLMAIAYAANIYGGQRLGPEALTWAITNILVNAAHPHDPAWVNMLKSMRGEY